MAEWLRPKFQRTPSSFLDEEHTDTEEDRIRNPSRVSSYLGLASRPPTLTSRPPTPSLAASESFNIRNPDVVYEKPSIHHMVESLKVAMMTKNSMEPLSIEYNSSVLHLLEDYYNLCEMLHTRDQTIEDMKEKHTKDIKDFEERATQWEAKEADYKSEMRKLEVLLAHTEGGMEKVALARTNSVLRGAPRTDSRPRQDSRVAEALVRAKNTLRAPPGAVQNTTRRERVNRSFQDYSVVVPETLQRMYRRNTFDAKSQQARVAGIQGSPVAKALHKAQSQGLDSMVTVSSPDKKSIGLGLGLTTTKLERLNQQTLDPQLDAELGQKIEGDFGVVFESSESSQTSSNRSRSSTGQDIFGGFNKPLPEIPPIAASGAKGTANDERVQNSEQLISPWIEQFPLDQASALQRKGFSFRPGDDAHGAFTAAETSRARAKREVLEEHLRKRNIQVQGSSSSGPASEDTVVDLSQTVQMEKDRASPGRMIVGSMAPQSSALSPGGNYQRPNLPVRDEFTRKLSASSAVTAIRDNSGRNSASGSSSGRQRLNRSSGSSEAATIAAARAISRNGSEGSGSDKNSSTKHLKEMGSMDKEVLHEQKEE